MHGVGEISSAPSRELIEASTRNAAEPMANSTEAVRCLVYFPGGRYAGLRLKEMPGFAGGLGILPSARRLIDSKSA